MKPLTKDFYLSTWNEIFSAYQWWGFDLMPLYDNIKKTNPNAAEVIGKMYDNFNPENYKESTILTFRRPSRFYQKLADLVSESDYLYTKLKVESLRGKKYEKCEISTKRKIHRMDYLLAILCMAEEFVQEPLESESVKFSKSALSGQNDNLIYLVAKDEKSGITKVNITIPKRIEITFDSSEEPME